jgi:rhodanese-related sulfurtransferase
MLSTFRKPAQPALDPRAAVSQVASGALTLVDLREPSEIRASGKAAGALTIPLAVLRMKADPSSPDYDARLSPDRPIALYCASGGRAGMAKGVLEGLGYRNVVNLGGLAHWAQAGGAVIRG